MADMGKGKGRNRSRANGEGWIKQRKDGRYSVGLHVWTPEGLKRKETTKKTRGEADKWLTKQKSDRDGGIVVSSDNPTVAEYAGVWLEDSVRGSVSIRTYKQYKSVAKNHIIPAIGGVKLRDLTARRIQRLYADERDSGLSVATRRHTHTTLKKMLNQAAEWGDIVANPAAFVKPPKGKSDDSNEGSGDIRPYSEDDLQKITGAAKGNRLAALYQFAPLTGLREQELLALTWDDLKLPDRGRGAVRVDKAVVELEHGFGIGPTKNRKSRRTVEFPESVVAVIRDHRRKLLEERVKARKWEENNLVFPNAHGALLNRYRLGRYFRKVREASGVGKYHQFKDFRHTYATLMFSRGFHPKIVQENMGHSSIKITMDTYSHYIPGMGSDAADALGDVF